MPKLMMIVACLAPAAAFAGPASGPKDQAKQWKRFAVEGIALGTSLDKLAGFTCNAEASVVTCVRFVDPRCQGKPTQVELTAAQLPDGAGCGFALTGEQPRTYLDHQAQPAPLSAVIVYGTSKRRVFEVKHTFGKAELTEQSRLGKTLIASFGKPNSTVAPIRMLWAAGSTTATADCDDQGGCSVMVTDIDLAITDEH